MPAGYADLFLLLVAAVGAALFLGTGAALLHYRRTGTFPGQPSASDDGIPAPPRVAPVVVRMTLGVALVAVGLTLVVR